MSANAINRLQALLSQPFGHRLVPVEIPGEPDRFRWQAGYAWLIIGFGVLQLLRMPDWLLSGEMWAEMATNYLPNASSSRWFDQLFAPDAGYIPLPQRLIALAVAQAQVDPTVVPFAYNWSAVLAAPAIVGLFIHSIFRNVLLSDSLRILVCVAVLLISDFETRNFINFTYFGFFFVAVATALAVARPEKTPPWWLWLVPVLLFSKAYAFVLVPGLALWAAVAERRYRRIALASLVVLIVQAVRVALSRQQGVMAQGGPEEPILEKAITAAKYALVSFSNYALGPFASERLFELGTWAPLCIGLLLSAGVVYLFVRQRSPYRPILLLAAMLIAGTLALNVAALGSMWPSDLSRAQGAPVYRHIIAACFGVILIIAVGAEHVGRSILLSPRAPALLFGAWLIATGWLPHGLVSLQRSLPALELNNSQWQANAAGLRDKKRRICIPVNPASWVYGRQCGILASSMLPGAPVEYAALARQGDQYVARFPAPETLLGKSLLSFALHMRHSHGQSGAVSARLVARSKNGTELVYSTGRTLPSAGGLVQFAVPPEAALLDVESVVLTTPNPMELGWVHGTVPSLLWMGY